jgi:hypothetical protein
MSKTDLPGPRKIDDDFVEASVVEAFVPSASEVNLSELVEAWDGGIPEGSNSVVSFVEQRQFLLLGTHLYGAIKRLALTSVQTNYSPSLWCFEQPV